MENRLLYFEPENRPYTQSAEKASSSPEVVGEDLITKRERDQEKQKSETERQYVRATIDIGKAENTFKTPEELEQAGIDNRDKIDYLALPTLQTKIKPDYQNWNYNSNEGLGKIFVEMKNLGLDVENDYYKSVFAILNNANTLIKGGQFDKTDQTILFSNPVANAVAISEINLDDGSTKFNGKMYLEALDQVVFIQQLLLKNNLSEKVAGDKSWGDQKFDNVDNFLGELGTDVKKALKEKNIPKLLMYGLGGFLAYKAGEHIWSKPVGKFGVGSIGLLALVYASGHGKGFEKLVGNIPSAYGSVKDNISGGNGPGDLAMGGLSLIGTDDEMSAVLAQLGITKENAIDVLGGGLNSVDNLEYVLAQSSDPLSAEIRDVGVDEKILYKIKDVNLDELNKLSSKSDKVDPTAKFIPPNDPLISKIFPEYNFIVAKLRTDQELKELNEQSGLVKTGSFSSELSSYVSTGKMLYNLVKAMKVGYREKIQPNNSNYQKLSFDDALSSPILKDSTVLNFLEGLREYTNKDNKKFVDMVKEMTEKIGGVRVNFDVQTLSYNPKTGVYDALIYGMPMRIYFNQVTGDYQLYTLDTLKRGEIVTKEMQTFLRIPSELKDGVFTEKYKKIIMEKNGKWMMDNIPDSEVKLKFGNIEKTYKKADKQLGKFSYSHGMWIFEVNPKDYYPKEAQDYDKSHNEVLIYPLLHVALVEFDKNGQPAIKFISPEDYNKRIDIYNQLHPAGN